LTTKTLVALAVAIFLLLIFALTAVLTATAAFADLVPLELVSAFVAEHYFFRLRLKYMWPFGFFGDEKPITFLASRSNA